MIENAWISKLFLDVAFTWRPRELSCYYCIKRFSVLREINSRFQFVAKLNDRCFVWFPAARLVPIQISINLGKTFLRISSIRKIAVTCMNLGESLCISTFFYFLRFLTLSIERFKFFVLIYFEWSDTENQQLLLCVIVLFDYLYSTANYLEFTLKIGKARVCRYNFVKLKHA